MQKKKKKKFSPNHAIINEAYFTRFYNEDWPGFYTGKSANLITDYIKRSMKDNEKIPSPPDSKLLLQSKVWGKGVGRRQIPRKLPCLIWNQVLSQKLKVKERLPEAGEDLKGGKMGEGWSKGIKLTKIRSSGFPFIARWIKIMTVYCYISKKLHEKNFNDFTTKGREKMFTLLECCILYLCTATLYDPINMYNFYVKNLS